MCSFEADYNWMRQLREIHGINNLVDDTGDIVEKDFGFFIFTLSSNIIKY
jgi:hypothetical protein